MPSVGRVSMNSAKVNYAEKMHFPDTSSTTSEPDCSGSVVIGEGSKRYIPTSYGAEEVYRSSCRLVQPVHRSSTPVDRVIVPDASKLQFTSNARDRDRRHLTELDLPSVKKTKHRELNWTRKRSNYGNIGNARNLHHSEEFSIESVMTRKHKIREKNLGPRRNFVSVSSLGDKPYKIPDHSPNFFKEGGLIVGSSIVQRTKASPVTSTITSNGKPLKSLSAHERRELESVSYDMAAIETLSNSFYKRGQQQPSWEEKTGMWLCRPEEEND